MPWTTREVPSNKVQAFSSSFDNSVNMRVTGTSMAYIHTKILGRATLVSVMPCIVYDRIGFLAEGNSFTLGWIEFYEPFRFPSLKCIRPPHVY